MCTMANIGNAATRLADAVQSGGAYARGADPDVDALYTQRARETESIWASGIGPRVAEPALMLVGPSPWSAPLEDVRLKGK